MELWGPLFQTTPSIPNSPSPVGPNLERIPRTRLLPPSYLIPLPSSQPVAIHPIPRLSSRAAAAAIHPFPPPTIIQEVAIPRPSRLPSLTHLSAAEAASPLQAPPLPGASFPPFLPAATE